MLHFSLASEPNRLMEEVGDDSSDPEDSQEDDEGELSEMSEDPYDDKTWIEWFCGMTGHEFFVEVEEEFIKDDFNLTGLSTLPHYDKALDVILDNEDDECSDAGNDTVERAAPHLYGLIHARYSLTSRGLQLATSKFSNGAYGKCPNMMCEGQNGLPVGTTDTPKMDTCKLYCPRCKEMYRPAAANRLGDLDGAYFGTTFAPLFCMLFPGLMPKGTRDIYSPKVYGFKVHRNIKDKHRKTIQEANQQQGRTQRAGTKPGGTSAPTTAPGVSSALPN
eukprot:GHVS01064582.1.p1 GENE.GHVS01064582.1~~GHVS01064582.1.p1  ORF type:complete len:276 (+),score=29.82 GHVS01064582.1:40-867(+)